MRTRALLASVQTSVASMSGLPFTGVVLITGGVVRCAVCGVCVCVCVALGPTSRVRVRVRACACACACARACACGVSSVWSHAVSSLSRRREMCVTVVFLVDDGRVGVRVWSPSSSPHSVTAKRVSSRSASSASSRATLRDCSATLRDCPVCVSGPVCSAPKCAIIVWVLRCEGCRRTAAD